MVLKHNSDLKEQIINALMEQEIETPSWGYASGGTRFFVPDDPTAARTLEEKSMMPR